MTENKAKKKILILGAGVYQVPLIKKAKEMGLFTIVSSIPGDYPGFLHADKVAYCDTRDVSSMFGLAREEEIDAVATCGTDVAVRTLGVLCDEFGLKGISEKAARLVTDKVLMKEAFAGKVATAGYEIIEIRKTCENVTGSNFLKEDDVKAGMEDIYERARLAANKIGYPVVVKAVDVSGSRGVTKVEEESGLIDAVNAAVKVTKAEHFIIEEYLLGHEIGVDAFVLDGKMQTFFPHEKFTASADGVTVPAGHAFPFEGSRELIENLRKEMQAAIDATGMDNCAVNADIMIDGDKVRIIEIGGRAGATCIPELIEINSGVDYYAAIINCALGQECDFEVKRNEPCSAMLLFADKDGIVESIDFDKIKETEQMYDCSISLDVKVGDAVWKMQNGTSRIGQVIFNHTSIPMVSSKLTPYQGFDGSSIVAAIVFSV